jgi:hypothetical protein
MYFGAKFLATPMCQCLGFVSNARRLRVGEQLTDELRHNAHVAADVEHTLALKPLLLEAIETGIVEDISFVPASTSGVAV